MREETVNYCKKIGERYEEDSNISRDREVKNVHTRQRAANTRNYGIDALRLLSMFMVVILHVLGYGGVLNAAKGENWIVGWLLEIMAYCAVDCFALISGYVGYTEQEKPYNFFKYISMWLQVVFYSFGISALAYVFRPGWVTGKDLIKCALPVLTSQYWYFSAYTGVFFLIPWLNAFVRNTGKKELNRCIAVIFLVFVCYGTLVGYISDSFKMNGGYSVIWLLLLYLTGAWMNKNKISDQISSKYALICICLCTGLTWFVKVCMPFGKDLLIQYISPTIVLCAVSYVILFSKFSIRGLGKKLVGCFAPAAFGVYLIHTQSMIWNHLIQQRFAWIADISVWKMPFCVLGCAVGIFVVCIIIEKVRLWIFKWMKIDAMVIKLVKRGFSIIYSIGKGCWEIIK